MPTTRPAPLTLATLEDHMVWVEGGVFEMGGEGYDEKPIHPVQLDGFYLCRYPVTQALWKAVIGSNPLKLTFPHPQRPVEAVSWYDCVEFCNVLSELQGYQPVYRIDRERKDPNNQQYKYDDIKWLVTLYLSANGYRLPTEAEWEYAARGGRYAQPFDYAGSPNLNEAAWCDQTSHDLSQPVGLKIPNPIGLFDMIGNVQEWVWDWYGSDYYQQFSKQPGLLPATGPYSGAGRGVRGGAWQNNDSASLRVTYRNGLGPYFRDDRTGFRLCRSAAASDFTR